MIRMKRDPEPPPRLAECAEGWTADYVAKKSADTAYRFRWPELTHNGERVPLNQYLLPSLLAATADHCAYCDSCSFGDGSRPSIDHFRPKGPAAFRHLAFTWENLFPACNECQQEKRERFDEELLKPDEATYNFDRYFVFNVKDGDLMPNPASDPADQARARLTIEILGLNAAPRRMSRRRWFERSYRDVIAFSGPELDELPYRYLANFTEC